MNSTSRPANERSTSNGASETHMVTEGGRILRLLRQKFARAKWRRIDGQKRIRGEDPLRINLIHAGQAV